MRPGRRAVLCFFLVLLGASPKVFPEGFILTDAEGGIFREDRYLSFSLGAPGRLRLLLDGREIYEGTGPAYPELGLLPGEERSFTLRAEYYSPESELLESRTWHIYIDKKAPSPENLEFRDTGEGLRLVQDGAGLNTRIRALADIEGTLLYFPDLGRGTPPAASFSALVWAEDLAGNCSEPELEYFELPPVKIENPVSGNWLNRQILVITGAEGKNIYWTADGTDPLEPGGSGRLYRGPVRVTAEGPVNLRAAWRDSGSLRHEKTVSYTVSPRAAGPGPLPESFSRAEERVLREETLLEVPDGWLWSAGGVPRTGGNVSLRPGQRVKRAAAFHFSPADSGNSYLYRCVFLLDGTEERQRPETVLPPPAFPSLEETPLYPLAGEEALLPGERNAASLPRLFSAGRCRLIVWPKVNGVLYYSWDDGKTARSPWLEGKGPLPVPPAGGRLDWFILNGKEAGLAGPYHAAIDPAPGKKEAPRGRIAFRRSGGKAGWTFASALLAYAPSLESNRLIDVCDGEDLEWAFIGSGGRILERRRRDRLAPPAPYLSAPGEKSWNRGPVELRAASDEESVSSITARLRYSTGQTETVTGNDSLKIQASLGESAEVTVECFGTDPSGNRSPVVIRNFTLDPKNIYVSPEPLLPPPASGSRKPGLPGGMDNPFSSLEEALVYAEEQELENIRIAGKLEIRKPFTVSRTLRIDGGWRREVSGGAALALGNDFFWSVGPGADLTLTGLVLERKEGEKPLIQAGRDSRLELGNVSLVNQGPLLTMEGGSCVIRDSELSLTIPGERRTAALSAADSGLSIDRSTVRLREDYSLLFSLRGGSFSARDSVFNAAGERTSALMVLGGTRGDFSGLTMTAEAGDYASVLEISGSEFFLRDCALEVSARDAGVILVDNSAAAIVDSSFRLAGSFTARAAEIRGPFPLVRNTRFEFAGAAKKAEVFSGTGASRPAAGSIGGNRFLGFTHIWGGEWPLETLGDFNSLFAPPENPNSVEP